MIINLAPISLSFLLSLSSILLGRVIFLRSRINRTKLVLEKNNKKIVKLGGIVIFVSVLLIILFFNRGLWVSNALIRNIFLSSFFMLLLGLLDDLFELKVIHKFWGETIIVLFFLWSSKLTTEIIFIPPALNFILTFIWILGITNAFNLLDILDGLATGVSFLVSLSFFFLAYITGNMWVGIISIILSACLLAVWFLNLPPAKVYLGDSGSLFLGFIFSTMAISISYTKPLHEIALFSPVLILGFPIYDTVFVSLMRILRKKPVFVKTDDHFVFKLIASGKKRTTSLFICYFMTGIFITLGIVLTALTNCFGMVLLSATLIFLIPISFKVSRVRN